MAPYQAAHERAAFFDLSEAAKIEIAGPEAAMFLHNLATCDIKNLAPRQGCEFFLTTNKARIIAHGAVSNHSTGLLLDADAGQAERICLHLNRHLISEQAEIADRTAEWSLLRLAGPVAEAIVRDLFGLELAAMPVWSHHIVDANTWIRRQGALALPGADLWCRPDAKSAIRDKLEQAGAVLGDAETYEILRVESGWPKMGADMDEQRFVVEVDRIPQAICYTKGCYLGQEPIVMARDRGQVNRHWRGLRAGAGPVLTAGAKVFRDGTEVGVVTSSVFSPQLGEVIALAYLKRGSEGPGTRLTLDPSSPDRSLEVCSFPFLTSP